MEFLIQWDQAIFIFVNETLQNPLFDIVLPLLRNKYIWIPFYIFIITYIFSNYSLQKASYYILFIISAVAITDVSSGQIIKKSVKRIRPCNDITLANNVQERVYCSLSYSFPSAHAANHFGLAVILLALFGKRRRWIKYSLFGWAAGISIAQVYVGIHYPLDVIGGGLLGTALVSLYVLMIRPLIERLNRDPLIQEPATR